MNSSTSGVGQMTTRPGPTQFRPTGVGSLTAELQVEDDSKSTNSHYSISDNRNGSESWSASRNDSGGGSSTAKLPLTRDLDPRSPNVAGMQKWEGTVLEVEETVFTAKLVALGHSGPEMIADFNVSDVVELDDQLNEGDVFYLTVRTVLGHGRQKHRTAALRLRRLGRWTDEEIERVEARASDRAARLQKYAE